MFRNTCLLLLGLFILAGASFHGERSTASGQGFLETQGLLYQVDDPPLPPIFFPIVSVSHSTPTSPDPTQEPAETPGSPPAPTPTPTLDLSGPAVMGVETFGSFGLANMPQPPVASYTRRNGILWSDVEERPGERNWAALAQLEQEMVFAAANGKEQVIIVRSTPKWAQKSGKYCGPITPEALPAFANFMFDLVARYSQPPYSVKYWEIWNEPDIDPSLVGSRSEFGCWGDSSDPYYGGGYYAEMLKLVYPAVKRADPDAQVLVGGLLLACDPRVVEGCVYYDRERPSRFLEGVLRNDGASFFDGVSFHSFDAYQGQLGVYETPSWFSYWNTTGPLVTAKARFLNELLGQYDAAGKYLMNTETAIMIYGDECDAVCETSKAYYVTQVYAASLAEGVRASIWYGLRNNWRHTSLFDPAGQPLPAYYAYEVAWTELSEAEFVREVSDHSGVKIFEFARDDHRLWILWSLEGTPVTIVVDGTIQSVKDALGQPVTFSGNSVSVDIKPVYLQWVPQTR